MRHSNSILTRAVFGRTWPQLHGCEAGRGVRAFGIATLQWTIELKWIGYPTEIGHTQLQPEEPCDAERCHCRENELKRCADAEIIREPIATRTVDKQVRLIPDRRQKRRTRGERHGKDERERVRPDRVRGTDPHWYHERCARVVAHGFSEQPRQYVEEIQYRDSRQHHRG